MFNLSRRAVAGGLVALLAVTGAACSDDDDEPNETGDAPTTTAAEETTTTAGEETTTTEGAAGEVIEIIGTNDGTSSYAFEDVPTDPVPAGSRLSLVNTGTEPHELILIRIPDEETRPVGDLVSLSDEELGAVFGGEPEPATVILAASGTTDTPGAVVGDGTVTEPGRYAVLCFLPVGSTDDLLEADGPPEDATTPPHAALGMFAELTVE